MNTEKLLAKFAAARTKQAQEENPAPIGSTQHLFGSDPLSSYDPKTDSIVNMTMAPAALAGGLYGAYGLGGTGRAINRAVEASRYINPLFKQNPVTGSRNFFPSYADLLLNSSIDRSVGNRALANIMPSMTPGLPGRPGTAANFQEFAPIGNTMDVEPVSQRMTRAEVLDVLRNKGMLDFLAPYLPRKVTGSSVMPALLSSHTPGRISYMGGGTPATSKKPAVPDAELESVTRQQLLTQRPGLGLLDPRLIGEGAAPIRYVSPTEAHPFSQGGAAISYIRPPVGTTDASGVSPVENPVRRGLGRLGNFLQYIDPKTGKARTATGLLGSLLASEGASYLQGDTNPTPYIADVKYDSPLR